MPSYLVPDEMKNAWIEANNFVIMFGDLSLTTTNKKEVGILIIYERKWKKKWLEDKKDS